MKESGTLFLVTILLFTLFLISILRFDIIENILVLMIKPKAFSSQNKPV